MPHAAQALTTIQQANELTEARYNLTLGETRIIFFALTCKKNGKIQREQAIKAMDLAKEYNIEKHTAYEEVSAAAKKLYERSIIRREASKVTDTIRWVSACRYDQGRGIVHVNFSPEVMPLLENLDGQFTSFYFEQIKRMTTPYASRIFVMMMQWKTTGVLKISVVELRERLELKDKYKTYSNLKLRVIKPSIEQIEKHANYLVQLREIKKGRSVDRLEFSFVENPQRALAI